MALQDIGRRLVMRSQASSAFLASRTHAKPSLNQCECQCGLPVVSTKGQTPSLSLSTRENSDWSWQPHEPGACDFHLGRASSTFSRRHGD